MWRYNYTYSNELYHHGTLGMKWGVRKYQNKDGSLTTKGKQRYKDDSKPNIIQRHKNNLIEKYKEKGYSDFAAEQAASHRMKTEAILGVIGAVAVGVIAVKASRKIGQQYFDKTLKSGKIIQNVGADGGKDFKNSPFYAAINSHDKKAYGAMYPHEKRAASLFLNEAGYKGIYNNKLQLTDNVRRASVSNARKTFYEQMNNDASFKKNVLETLKKTKYTQGVSDYETYGGQPKRLYDSFNQALATPEVQQAGLNNKFYSALRKKGYNAVLDINDSKYSGYKNISKDPTIFFGNKWNKIANTKINEDTITENAVKYAVTNSIKTQGAKYAAIGGGAAGYASLKNQKKIEEYLDEHPNSKLTKRQILEMLNK